MKKSFFRISLPAAIVCALIFLFFLPNLLHGKIPIPADSLLGLYHPFRDNAYDGYSPYKFPTKNPLITDPILQIYPWKKLVFENFKAGFPPLWNPYSFSGQPLLANIQAAPFSAFNILFFVLPFKFAWGVQIILAQILAGLFMYLFLKNRQLSTFACVFGAVVLPFSGFFVAWMTWSTIVTTAMWLPLILLSIDKIFEKRGVLPFLVLIFAASQTVFSGHLQTAFYVFLASVIYLFTRFMQNKSSKHLKLAIAAIAISILISSVQILPSFEFIQHSLRSQDQGYYPARRDWFIPLQNFTQVVAPDFFGNPATYNYWGVWNWAEFVSYFGIVPLFLAILAILKRQRGTRFFVGIALLSLLLAVKNPISTIPYTLHFPFLASTQPSRIIFLLLFALCALSAYGLDLFLKGKHKKIFILSSLGIISACILLMIVSLLAKNLFPKVEGLDAPAIALRNLVVPTILALSLLPLIFMNVLKVDKKIIVGLIFALMLFDLFRFAYKFTPFTKVSLIFPQTAITNFLAMQEKPFRIATMDRRIMHPNVSSAYKIESVDGYDPLFLKNYAQFVTLLTTQSTNKASSFNRIVTPQNFESSLIDLLNVRYVLSFNDISNPKLTKLLEEGQTKLYENKSAYQRAFFVDEVAKVSNDQEELQMLNKNLNLKKTAVSQQLEYENKQNESDVSFISYNDQKFSLMVTTRNQAPLVVSNIYYPGWQAKIDGRKTQIYEADFTFQSVLVPAGTHIVDFEYRPATFYNGLYLSFTGVAFALISTLILWRKKYLS